MKAKHLVVVILLLLVMGSQAQIPIFRGPPVSSFLYTNLAYYNQIAQSQTYPKRLIIQEGQGSDPYSSVQGLQDYFAVYIPALPDRGTILVMDPIPTGYYGVLSYPVHFRDVLNGGDYYVSFNYATLTGSFTIAGQSIWMKINYDSDLTHRYPYVQLTWGDGATFGVVGAVYDDFEFAVADDYQPPTTLQMAVVNSIGVTDVPDGVYVAIITPDEHYTLQSTTDFRTWKDEAPPMFISGYIAIHYYPATNAVTMNRFFHSKR